MSCNSYLEREIYRQYYIHHIKCTHVFLQTTREIFALKHHHLSLHITILFILDVANIFLITVIYEDINIDIISYTIVFSCNPHDFLSLVNQVESGNWEPQFEQIILNFLLSIITVVMYCTVLYCTVLYCTGPYTAIHSHDVSISIITAIIL